MPAINFKKEFAEDVKSGRKRQTIRTERKNPIKKGDTLYLYTGMRTKKCELLKTNFCHDVLKIKIDTFSMEAEGEDKLLLHLNSVSLNREAKKDGFECWEHMRNFFFYQYGLPFEGVLIKW